MSYVIAAPEMMAAAAADLGTIGSTLSVAHTAAAAPTAALVPAAADEVSASITHLFSAYAQDYQALAGRAAAFHEQFVQHLNASAHSYASAEAANASSLRSLNASTASHASASAVSQQLLYDLLIGYVYLLEGYSSVLQYLALLPSTIPNPLLQALAAAVITQLEPLFTALSILLLLPVLPILILG
ncbi:MAG: PE family protein [Mycobacterium sp.]|uniref:PE family protein n=1 Tax=Mycobacterium sp. TaxID=1785 RepID=UPI003F962972